MPSPVPQSFNMWQVLQPPKRQLDQNETRPAQRWHPKHPRHRGPKITLESSDHCLFRVTHELLRTNSGFFANMFNDATDCDEVIAMDMSEHDLALLLDLLRETKLRATIIDGISYESLGALMTAVDKYDIFSLEFVLDAEVEKKLALSPVLVFQLASDLNNMSLAKRAIASMTGIGLQQHFETLTDVFRFVDGLRPEWQFQFLRLLLCGRDEGVSTAILDISVGPGPLDSSRFDCTGSGFYPEPATDEASDRLRPWLSPHLGLGVGNDDNAQRHADTRLMYRLGYLSSMPMQSTAGVASLAPITVPSDRTTIRRTPLVRPTLPNGGPLFPPRRSTRP